MAEPEKLLYGVNWLEDVQRWKETSGRDVRDTAPTPCVAGDGKRFLFQHRKVETCRSGKKGLYPKCATWNFCVSGRSCHQVPRGLWLFLHGAAVVLLINRNLNYSWKPRPWATPGTLVGCCVLALECSVASVPFTNHITATFRADRSDAASFQNMEEPEIDGVNIQVGNGRKQSANSSG